MAVKYRIKAGVLYGEGDQVPLARLERRFRTQEKRIVDGEGRPAVRIARRRYREAGGESPADRWSYEMEDMEGRPLAQVWPDYTSREGPGVQPLNRLPRVDRARLRVGEEEYLLVMKNSRSYCLYAPEEQVVLRMEHQGVAGGWQLESWKDFSPGFLCGFFVVCRYLEEENELLIV